MFGVVVRICCWLHKLYLYIFLKMQAAKSARYQQNIKNVNENQKIQSKSIIKIAASRTQQLQAHPDKQQSKSVQQKYLHKKLHDRLHPNLLSADNLLKNLQNQLLRQSPPKNRSKPELLAPKQLRIEFCEATQTSDKNRRHRMAVIPYKNNHNNKTPTWILNRKKQRDSDLHSIPKESTSNQRDKQGSPIRSPVLNFSKENKTREHKSKQSLETSIKKQACKTSPICAKKTNFHNTFSFKQTNNTLISNMNESLKFSLFSNKFEKMTELELNNLKLEQELKDLKFKYENIQEDYNLMIIRMKTVESELELYQKKLKENIFKEEHYRSTENSLREKIEELQQKLYLVISNKQSQKNKKILLQQTNYPFSYYFTADKEIIEKKNEQIQKLNDIIAKLRDRVREINHELSQQKIRNITTLRNVEQKYQLDCAEREISIRKLTQKLQQKNENMLINHQGNIISFNGSLNIKRQQNPNPIHKQQNLKHSVKVTTNETK